MQKAGLDYVIVEKGSGAGSFYERYPRHRQLISINKVHTGYDDFEKNLRWDWNSLICDSGDLQFKEYSKRYFPCADDMVRYIRDFARAYDLNVHYDMSIAQVSRNGVFEAVAENGAVYRARRVIVATGVSKPYMPAIEGLELAEPYQEFSTDPDDFLGQSVLIIGKGNSGFETADNLIETTSLIHIASPRSLNFAWTSKFVGHLRAVNNNLLDTYQLKAQNAILDGEIRKIERSGDKFVVTIAYTHANGESEQLEYDRVLSCTGFRFDWAPYDETCRPALAINDRFPKMTAAWESVNVPDMYFAGTITQERDYRKSASGFIHGFRYNARALFRLLCDRYEGLGLSATAVAATPEAVGDAIIGRANRTSGLWQMFGFLCDVVQVGADGTARYLEELPVDYVRSGDLAAHPHYYTLTLEFGEFDTDPFAIERNPNPAKAHDSKFLHPVIRRFEHGLQTGEVHLLEDLHSDWSKQCHREPLKAFLDERLGTGITVETVQPVITVIAS
jgi:thioredoxin reductase